MKDLNEISDFSKYFRVISPSEININKEEIFYREKYNDIINYIKALVTFNDKSVLEDYLSPKGAVLINVNPGTDIFEFIKLISMNYHLELIEFNFNEIKKAPEKFLTSFELILNTIRENSNKKLNLNSEKEDEVNRLSDSERQIEKKLLIINQVSNFKTILKEKNLLEIFFDAQNESKLNFLDSHILLMWINYDLRDIIKVSSKIYSFFDLFIKIHRLSKIERETVFRDFLETKSKIVFDINALVNQTANWEVIDIRQLLKVGIFKQFLNSELNDSSNEITHILLDLIDTGEYLPSGIPNNLDIQIKNKESEVHLVETKEMAIKIEPQDGKNMVIEDYTNNIRESSISEFMLSQLYENAASKNYSELILIIDKINKNESLEENDRKLLAKYPFILNDFPNRAQINIEKAKKKVDHIKQAFGK
ncbi:MAG: hypothetical protein ACXABO_07110 [Promethearchaeota archaeon]|jgi:hypothetical protein